MTMVRFLIRRIITGILVLWLVATGTFFLFFAAVPVQTVARNLAGRARHPAGARRRSSKYYGLDRPLFDQYLTFLNKLVHGNLGVVLLHPGAGHHDHQAGPAGHRSPWSSAACCSG